MSDEQYSTPAGQSPALGALTGAGRVGPCHFPLGAMSLRDYFAAKALPVAIETMQRHRSALLSPFEWDKGLELEIAQACYSLADAMLEARK